MKTWHEPKNIVAVIYVLCFPPSLCPSNPTPTLLSRKPHIPPPLLTPPCTPVPSFTPSHTQQSFLLSSPSPPGSLLCPPVSWSHQLSHSSHTAHHHGSQPVLPPALLTASAGQCSVCIHRPNFFLPLLMNTYCPVYTSSRRTSVPALCSQVWDPISPIPGRSRSCHDGWSHSSSTALGRGYTGMLCWHMPWSSKGWVTSGLLSTRGWGPLMDGEKSLQKNGVTQNRDESAKNTHRCLQALSP